MTNSLVTEPSPRPLDLSLLSQVSASLLHVEEEKTESLDGIVVLSFGSSLIILSNTHLSSARESGQVNIVVQSVAT